MSRESSDRGERRQLYSVLMPVYGKERPDWFLEAAKSMMAQTAPPDEFVIVCDGPLTEELEAGIEELKRQAPGLFSILRLNRQEGLGKALAKGVLLCKNSLIARMDSDDVALRDRCERQLAQFSKDPSLALLSGAIQEFSEGRGRCQSKSQGQSQEQGQSQGRYQGQSRGSAHFLGQRRLPLTHREIRKFARKRNPMNHMAVMMRREAVLAAGNYREMPGAEDYYLWARMLSLGFRAGNLPQVLVMARAGEGMMKRRGGLAYTGQALRFQRELLRMRFISPGRWGINCTARAAAGLLPARARERLYRRLLREQGRSGRDSIGKG